MNHEILKNVLKFNLVIGNIFFQNEIQQLK